MRELEGRQRSCVLLPGDGRDTQKSEFGCTFSLNEVTNALMIISSALMIDLLQSWCADY